MISTVQAATDDMFQMVQDVVNTSIKTYLGYSLDVRWQGVEKIEKPDIYKLWARVIKLENTDEKSYVSSANGSNFYTHKGLLSVEFFGPVIDLTSWEKITYCADVMRKKFKSTSPLGIQFKDARSIECPKEESWYKVNMIVDYSYDEG